MKQAAWVLTKKHLPRLMTIFLIGAMAGSLLFFYGSALETPWVPQVVLSLLLGGFIGVSVLAFFLPLMIYFKSLSQSKKMLEKLTAPTFTMTFELDAFRVQSSLADSTIQWSAFQKLYPDEQIWLLFPNSASYFVIPTKSLSDELSAFILRQLEECHVPICQSTFSI